MRTTYMIEEIRYPPFATADLYRRFGNLWEMARISVPPKHRGKGYASRMLRQVCEDADRDGIDIILYPVPSGPLSRANLVAWYERYGWATIPHDPAGAMLRKAQPVDKGLETAV